MKVKHFFIKLLGGYINPPVLPIQRYSHETVDGYYILYLATDGSFSSPKLVSKSKQCINNYVEINAEGYLEKMHLANKEMMEKHILENILK